MAANYIPVSGPIEYTPDPYQTQCRLRLERDTNTGLFVVRSTTDGGQTWREVFTDPVGAQIGTVLTVDPKKSLSYRTPTASPSTSPGSLSSSAVSIFTTDVLPVEFQQFGTIYAGQTFGFYQAPSNQDVVCLGVQLSLQTAAVSGTATVCLVQVPSNVETVQAASLSSGVEFGSAAFGTALVMPAGTQWRARVKAVGSVTAGECLCVRLLLAPRT